ncbi:MAG: biotin--[Clostridia bacterium]|nr:biotin--[acetyl-CoA-carboxylase] ligase [Clostridia bacterium]MBR0228845.1 biotin--[acetyl-CoA-carboxylase] ligase [Clostridia bacterium]
MERAEEAIRRALGSKWEKIPLRALVETDSTNLRLKEAYREGRIAPPYLLTADSQTAGRGRLGRRFVSPPGTGLYMSLLAAPPPNTDCGLITILAAVAVCRAIEETTDLRPKIKWVNDLFVNGKKVCGILAEGLGGPVIVGIGVNLRTPLGGFPPEAGPAGALDADVEAPLLAGRIARYILDGLESPNDPAIIDAYRQRMPLTGQTIRYTQNGQEKTARVTGVSTDGGLMVEDETGPHILRTGEVSLGSGAFEGFL